MSFEPKDITGKYEYPEDRFVLTGDWELSGWGFNAAVNYIGSFEDLNGSPDYAASTRDVDAFVTLNLQARYTGFDGLKLAGAPFLLASSGPRPVRVPHTGAWRGGRRRTMPQRPARSAVISAGAG